MANISKVYLLDTPLESDMKHTLYFANASSQHSYMSNCVIKTYTNVSYQRDTATFRCPAHIDSIRQCNYMMYQNTAYSNKWFYCFIEKMTYISDGLTDVVFKVDPIQTFMFDFETQPSFIEREHTNNDTRGNNTLPENFELGEYIKNMNIGTPSWGFGSTILYAVGVSEIVGTINHTPASNINGIPNGLFYVFTDSVSILHKIAQIYDWAGKAQAIYTMFAFPKSLLWNGGGYSVQNATWSYNIQTHTGSFSVQVPTGSDSVGVVGDNYTVPVPTRVGMSYSPRNQKLLTYPYCYFNISNSAGSTVTYHYEDFDGTPKFKIEGIISVGCSIKAYPLNYRNMDIFTGGQQDNTYDYGINAAKFPTISWNSDSYTNWLTQNSTDIAVSTTTAALAAIGTVGTGVVTGNPLAGYAGYTIGANAITNAVKQVYEASLMPDQAKGNTNVGDLNYTKNKNKFTIYAMSIKPEYARIIDDYFDMFGYKTLRVKKPNYNHRANWWYTKTIDIYIKGNIPNEYMQQIKDAYNNGITYWRNPSNFMDYSVSNGIV